MDVAEPIDNGRYRLVELLGSGGMAAVYRAWDARLSAWRAVKVLDTRAAASASVRSRFEDEARAMARLQHRNILTVHEFGLDHDRPFIVMELVAGGSLGDVVERDGPLKPALATAVLAKVLDALQFAHDNDVVHRDIKPHNIMLAADGEPLVADFGIARIGGELESARTRTGVMMGTLAYMAPEQRTNARRVDGRADVYAAGNTLYALLTGEEPFDLYALADDDPQLDALPDALRPIVRRSTAHSAEHRFATAAEMAAALRQAAPAVVHIERGVSKLDRITQWDSAPPVTPAPAGARDAAHTVDFDSLPDAPEPDSVSELLPQPLPAASPVEESSGGYRRAVFRVLGVAGLVAVALFAGRWSSGWGDPEVGGPEPPERSKSVKTDPAGEAKTIDRRRRAGRDRSTLAAQLRTTLGSRRASYVACFRSAGITREAARTWKLRLVFAPGAPTLVSAVTTGPPNVEAARCLENEASRLEFPDIDRPLTIEVGIPASSTLWAESAPDPGGPPAAAE